MTEISLSLCGRGDEGSRFPYIFISIYGHTIFFFPRYEVKYVIITYVDFAGGIVYMSETVPVEQLLHRAHLFIAEGQEAEALSTLEKVKNADEKQKREIVYLRAWSLTLHGQWDEAAKHLLNLEISGERVDDIQTLGQTERRRRAYYLLLLGNIAHNLGLFEEAIRHYSQCIQFLDERRMNVVSVRIKARCGLGASYTQTGFYTVALTHYEDALRLCNDDSAQPDLPDIYYGLADIQRHLGNFSAAFSYGKQALELYGQRKAKDLEGRVRNLLGRISYQMGDFHGASYYYTEALTTAFSMNSPRMIMNNLVALADLRREEGLLDESWRYCERALDYEKSMAGDNYFLGMLYIVCGKVVEAGLEKTAPRYPQEKVDEALSWYRKAETIYSSLQARVLLAEVYGRLAHLLEETGQQDQAISYWKSAFAISSPSQESS